MLAPPCNPKQKPATPRTSASEAHFNPNLPSLLLPPAVYINSTGLPGSSALEVTSRLLLPAGRIGGVIGRGGEVIKGIREMTRARITIASSGTDDRAPNTAS